MVTGSAQTTNDKDSKNLSSTQQTNNFNRFGYYQSSGAISFAAWMKILEVSMEAYQDQAKLSEQTSTMRGQNIIDTVAATGSIFDARAQGIRFQMGDAIAQATTSGFSMIGNFATPKICGLKDAQDKFNNLKTFENGAKDVTGCSNLVTGQARPAQESPAVMRARSNLRNGNLEELKDVTDGINAKVDGNSNKLTYKELLETTPNVRNANGISERDEVMKNIARCRESREKDIHDANNQVQYYTSTFQMITQAANGSTSAAMKSGQASQTTLEGQASQQQQTAQACQQFNQEINKSQQDQYSQYVQNTQQTFRNIAEVVGVDTRG